METIDKSDGRDSFTEDKLQDEKLQYYSKLLNQKNWKLAFPNEVEKAYQYDIKKHFIETNKFVVCFGVLFYASFFIIDYLFYEELMVEVLAVRIIIAVLAGFFLSAIFFKKSIKNVLSVTLACAIVMGLQVVLCAIFAFKLPYNLLYAIGVLPIIVFGILVFRFSFKHTLILVASLFSAYLLHVIISFQQDAGVLQEMLNVASPIMVVFVAAICTMGLYMSYAVDKLNRSDWLKNHIMLLESDKLNKLTQKLENLSITDGLTGLYNRRYFDSQLQTYWQKSTQNNTPLSMVMLDLDWYKPYNDFYGHQQGDLCLQHISDTFVDTCKQYDSVVARYGGEEFIIILPNMEAEIAHKLAQQLCDNVYAHKINHELSPLKFCSVSVGVNTCYPAAYQNKTKTGIDEFLKEVDEALYQAKSAGKNRVQIYSESAHY